MAQGSSTKSTPLPKLKQLSRHPAFLAISVILLLMPFFIHGVLYQKLVTEPQDRALQKAIETVSNDVARAVSRDLGERRGALLKLAQSPAPNAMMASDADYQASIEVLRKQFVKIEPHAEAVHLVRHLEEWTDRTNFLAKTLIQTALSGDSPPITTMKQGGWLVLVAEPITINGEVNGAVLIEFSFAALDAVFKNLDSSKGQLQLVQQIPQLGRQILTSYGSAGVGQSASSPVVTVPDWQIVFTPSQKMVGEYHPRPGTLLLSLQLGLGGISLLGILLTGFIVARKLNVGAEGSGADTIIELVSTRSVAEATAYFWASINDRSDAEDSPEGTLAGSEAGSDAHIEDDVFEISDDRDVASSSDSEEGKWPEHVFRSYDIRGLAGKEISEDFAHALGQTLGTHVLEKSKHDTIIVGRDGRLSSLALCEALVGGILMTGCNVIDLGLVPTPALNFAAHMSEISDNAVMVTASHNPGACNGFKLISSGSVIHGPDIQALRNDMLEKNWSVGEGRRSEEAIGDSYVNAIGQNVEPLVPLKVAVDCGNGVAGILVPQLIEKLGCECVPLYCDVNGAFPNHPPDPTQEENLQDLIQVVEKSGADLGLAFDGDGDRLVAITASGHIVWPDELMMIFARDVLIRQPGADIVYDVKSTRRLAALISDYGGRPVMWKTGHANIRDKVVELEAPLGGEFSGHLFFRDRWYGFDDGLYAAARLLEVLVLREQSLDAMLDTFEPTKATPEIRIAVAETEKFSLMEKIIAAAGFEDANINTLDGLRVDFEHSWGLVRASNTEAALTLRFEARDSESLESIKDQFRALILSVEPELKPKLLFCS